MDEVSHLGAGSAEQQGCVIRVLEAGWSFESGGSGLDEGDWRSWG